MTDLTDFKSDSQLQPSKFRLIFKRMPAVTYFCKRVSLPGLELTMLNQPTPFIDRQVAGNKLRYTPFEISFVVDEEMVTWEEIHNWLRGLGIERGYNDFKNLPKTAKLVDPKMPQYSDATLEVLSVKNNPIIRYHFYDCFPVTLSATVFDTSIAPTTPIVLDATFGFFYYELERVSS